ncbi:S8 family serine peptidase [Curvivirga aplysinae]|uniref:S8 family serine peptidase n=1 Tax=Curvivirga aplysinae TaxID=2529852 RepID=UPI0012BD74B6|nr:S8 family serine peptidase [Curvivirga aplysinae]MTI10770.1 hypothetical protein [Curvivirga aplysinae]
MVEMRFGLRLGFISTFLLGLITYIGPSSTYAQSTSCWTIITYDSDGTPQSGRNCVDPVEAETEKQESQTKRRQQKITESGEIMIADPPFGTKTKLRQMGYEISGKHRLSTLDMEIIVVKTPEDKNLADALKELIAAFPNSIIDTNDLMDLSAKASAEDLELPYDRKTVGWGLVDPQCGFGLKIGMVDGAVDVKHPALKNQRLSYKSFIKKGRKAAAYEHGTAVAIMLVGEPGVEDNIGGILPGAKLYAANIFEERAGMVKGNLAAMLRSLDWFAQNKVKVVNMSIAGGINKIMKLALRKIEKKGIIIVAAAGNNGSKAAPVWPAADPSVLAITAIDHRLGVYKYANQGKYIDFAAPGVGIKTLTPQGPKSQTGTSFATPYITGIVALHLQMGFKGNVEELRKSMQRYSKDLGKSGKDKTYGWGLVRIKPSCS